jgi:hypothetical protein
MNSAMTEAIHGFLHNRAEEEAVSKAKVRYRDVLRTILLQDGREDENGHRHMDFLEPLTVGGKTWKGIMAQRRISASIDLDKVEALVRAKGLYDEVFPEVRVRKFDEDKLYILNQRELITDAELDGLITENISFAIVPVKS